ncbi:hypothetical protein B9Z55_002365 [Caenorhabditis nigoni]|uniref:Peptidase S1 domain-containing protein n=1 Tax=Caenorhabditis nigoni TaxID=1611254 RepID=A0A2G5VK26_9PELO|nr:hypothetical protein B9Z55_002365 [Caenorhabditis nigoni]
MRISILILACLFFSLSVSDKLSEAEDEERSNECGRAFDTEGHLNDELSPWTVRLRLSLSYVSASLISKRHVITSLPALMEIKLIKERFKHYTWLTDFFKKTCNDGVMEVPIGSLKVDFQACSTNYRCPWIPEMPVKSVQYIGPCSFYTPGRHTDALILIEMEKDIPDDFYHYTPVCLPGFAMFDDRFRNPIPNYSDVVNDGDDLQVHQADHATLRPVINIISAKVNYSINSRKIRADGCDPSISNILCADLDACLNSPGAGLLKKADDRIMVVAFSEHYEDKCTVQKFLPVLYHQKKICELSGICRKTSTDLFNPNSRFPPMMLKYEFNKLSSDENEENAKTCGKPSNPDSKLESELSPWTVTIKVENASTGNTSSQIWTSATMISKRHVVVGAIALMNGKEGDWNTVRWVPDGKKVDMSKCKNNVMEIPVEYMRKTKVFMSPCIDQLQCESGLYRFVRSAVYLGVCEPDQMAFGVILLEVWGDVPPRSLPNTIPICLPEKRMPRLEKNLELHALRMDNKTGYVRSISAAQTVQCNATRKYYNKICFTRPTCLKFSSGGLLRKENGEQKLIGMMYYHSPDCKENNAVSIEVLADLFCVYAGICKVTTKEQPKQEKLVQLPEGQDGTAAPSSSIYLYSGVLILLAIFILLAILCLINQCM